ncbi:uncharacterized protein L969DRAFT_88865 [Mixia osmundae IAM 14324]|uniref:Uncharacterized protein n=1 Tax=Mixia osmundae (strain CBS 9802 / IAM 14324 / JCM 22182 / KY 12970) TaxID=764103 RepID=G7E7L6_MIXOS|nr:uncharacterized protein L969DRAFT_88865 [Mixia osmundae IAM 14324]KEI38428.1 hypothetical protein L969DRAFT_88865 [Mixia osmundae IAM 14324]GAA98826.1 hypothetical protein E5Q_05514 [Mixia osmundae IAM 14324]
MDEDPPVRAGPGTHAPLPVALWMCLVSLIVLLSLFLALRRTQILISSTQYALRSLGLQQEGQIRLRGDAELGESVEEGAEDEVLPSAALASQRDEAKRNRHRFSIATAFGGRRQAHGPLYATQDEGDRPIMDLPSSAVASKAQKVLGIESARRLPRATGQDAAELPADFELPVPDADPGFSRRAHLSGLGAGVRSVSNSSTSSLTDRPSPFMRL